MALPSGFKLPKLPSGWSYVNEDLPPEEPASLTGDEASKRVGSILRQIQGPRQPPEQTTLTAGFLKPVAKEAFNTLVPHTPTDLGIFAASLIFAGPGGPLTRAALKMAPDAVPLLESLGATGTRRVLGTGLGGMLGSKAGGDSALGGLVSGIATQLGGEAVSKLSKWLRMNAQAVDLAREDPERLGKTVATIIPGLKDLKTANDFHAAFNSGGAQQVLSDAYRQGMSEVSSKVGQTPIRSTLLDEMRSAGAQPVPGSVIPGLGRVGGNITMVQPTTAQYSFGDAVETLKRLRTVGWNEGEVARGLAARDAREAADQLSKEILSSIPPDMADKFVSTDQMYSRGQRLKDLLQDPKLLDKKGELNVPRIQEKFKQEGYNPRQSLQLAADAVALKESIFRGADKMVEDVPGQPGKLLDHFRVHFGIVPTFYPSIPKVGSYAGRAPYGLSPGDSSQLVQMLKRGTAPQERPPITLTAPTKGE